MLSVLAHAEAAHKADLERVVALEPLQQEYLARLAEVEDPLSDGLACDHDHPHV